MSRRAKQVLFSLVPALVLTLGLELLLRAVDYRSSLFDTFRIQVCGEVLAAFDEDLFWRKPGAFARFPDPAWPRVACLADSVAVMADGKGYPEMLEVELRHRFPERLPSVFNGGVPGYTSFQGLRFLERDVVAGRPDVVTACFGWNDHWQSGNGLPDKLQKYRKTDELPWLMRHSRALGWFSVQLLALRQLFYRADGPERTQRVGPLDFEQNLEAIVRCCRKHDIGLVLMTAPYLAGDKDWVPKHLQLNELVRTVAERRGIPLVDLVDSFRNRPDLFLKPETDPTHYNRSGSLLVARALLERVAEVLVSRSLAVPEPPAGHGGRP